MNGSTVVDAAARRGGKAPDRARLRPEPVPSPGRPRLLRQVADDSLPSRPLWDAATGQFDPSGLRGAIVARGWTVREFSRAAGVSHESVYRALRRFAVSDRTVVRIVAALESRTPSELIGD